MLPAVFDHLWQSTLFAGVAALVTLALGKNRARVRHWVWFAASLKFLIPVSLFIALGSHMEWRMAPVAPPNISVVMDEVSQPFTGASAPLLATVPTARNPLPGALLGIWGCGFIGISCAWWVRWRRVRTAVRAGSPVEMDIPIRAMCSPTLLEPGVFGVWRPVLLLPEGIFDRLTTGQLQAVIEHELCHVRHRDNLAAAIHMCVETLFWFHPLVWWIGKRMVDERERGCDEEVVSRGGEARVYAEAILNVCKLYVESPLECVAGVTGADLKKRIEGIMARRVAVRLSFAKQVALTSVGLGVVAIPVLVGVMHAQPATESSPKFEVASVKPSGPGDGGFKGVEGRGGGNRGLEHRRLTLRMNLYALIVNAYSLRGCPPFGEFAGCKVLSGGPDWMRKDQFEVVAKAPDDSPDYTGSQFVNLHAPQIQMMLQALLADRFALKVHHETKELPLYALTVEKKGPKFKKSDGSKEPRIMFRGVEQPANGPKMIRLICENGSMQELVDLYAKFMDRPVVDRTGLTDRYDFTMDYEANADTPGSFTELTGPGLFKAFEEHEGLKWEATKGPVEILVIDHAERPSAN
jgi:bla regulator protein BlaR1